MSEEKAESILANSFCNIHGKARRSISMDSFLEHETNSIMTNLDLLGPNFKEESAQRIASLIGVHDGIFIDSSVYQHCKKSKDDTRLNAFLHIPGRAGYYSFPKISANLVNEIEYRDLCRWIRTRLHE